MDLARISRRSRGPGLPWPLFALLVVVASVLVKILLSVAGVPT